MRKFTNAETATILAAIRFWQAEGIADRVTPTGTIVRPTACNMVDHFEEVEPLNKKEIDALCEAISFGEIGVKP